MAPLTMALALLLTGAQASDPCAAPEACRRVDTITIDRPGSGTRAIAVNDTLPWVVQDNILLLPGESVTVALDRRGDALVPRLVRGAAGEGAPAPGAGEIRFTLGRGPTGGTLLRVESRYRETIDYAALMVLEPGGPRRTSVCSLQSGVAANELWSDPIRQLAIWSFRPTREPGCKTISFPAR